MCGGRADVIKSLLERYDEKPVSMGIANNGGVLEVLVGGNTWTIIITMPNGTACLIAAGEDWAQLQVKKGRQS